MKMILKFLIVLVFGFTFSACQNEPPAEEEGSTQNLNDNLNLPFRFVCQENSDSSSIQTLFLLFDDNKVAMNSIPACAKIQKNQWKILGIPEAATMVYGGKWESGSAYHYAMIDSTQVKIFQISSDELDGEVAAPSEIYHFEIKPQSKQ